MDYNIGAEKSRISAIGYIIKRWTIRAAVMLLIVIIAGVSIVHFYSYNKFSLTEGIAHFSFEYPSSYYVEFTRLEERPWDYTMVRLLTLNPESEYGIEYYHDAVILINVEDTGYSYSSIEDAIEKSISWWTSRGYDDFHLIERSTVKIAGVQGGKLVYAFNSYHRMDATEFGTHSVKTPAITRRIFFEHEGKIWLISSTAYESYAETAKADFEHVIKTFKILE
jgi:hypothetical protein